MTVLLLSIVAVFFKSLSVATLAEGMMQDAWNYYSSKGGSTATKKVAVFDNNDIRRLSEVSRYGWYGSLYTSGVSRIGSLGGPGPTLYMYL